MIKFYFRDRSPVLVDHWRKQFANHDNFDIEVGDIFSVKKATVLISPSNSLGFMDGGIDAVYTAKLGPQVERAVRARIAKEYHGELPVGQAFLELTGDPNYQYLACAPTMRTPGVVRNTVNAYLAFRAALLAIKGHPDLGPDITVLCPGLGTGAGDIKPFACARQMVEAYRAIWLNQPHQPADCADLFYRQQELLGWPPTELKVDGVDIVKRAARS